MARPSAISRGVVAKGVRTPNAIGRHAEIGRSRQRRQRAAAQQPGDPAPHDDRQQRRERRLDPPCDIDPRARAAAAFAEPDDAEQREREERTHQVVGEMAADQGMEGGRANSEAM